MLIDRTYSTEVPEAFLACKTKRDQVSRPTTASKGGNIRSPVPKCVSIFGFVQQHAAFCPNRGHTSCSMQTVSILMIQV